MSEITNEEIMKKLEVIDSRLKKMEKTVDKVKEVLPMLGISI